MGSNISFISLILVVYLFTPLSKFNVTESGRFERLQLQQRNLGRESSTCNLFLII